MTVCKTLGICIAVLMVVAPVSADPPLVVQPAGQTKAPAVQTARTPIAKHIEPPPPPPPPPPPEPKPYRLRMQLGVGRTTDIVGSVLGGNSEDEVYYALAMQRTNKPDALPQMKTVHRVGLPSIWEMGGRSQSALQRILFEGKLPPDEEVVFVLAIGEQDNSEAKGLSLVLSGMFTLAGEVADASNGGSNAEKLSSKLKGQMKAIVDRIGAESDELIGAIVISLKGGKLKVLANSQVMAKVTDDNPHAPVVELNGAGSFYRLRLYVEDPQVKPPVDNFMLAVEEDNCGGDLWIDTKEGKLQLKKGKSADFRPKDPTFLWYCDGSEEKTRANAKTTFVEASRDPNGREILWRTYSQQALTPDMKP